MIKLSELCLVLIKLLIRLLQEGSEVLGEANEAISMLKGVKRVKKGLLLAVMRFNWLEKVLYTKGLECVLHALQRKIKVASKHFRALCL